MLQLSTKQFEINYQQGLKDFVNKSIKLFDDRYDKLVDLFDKECEKVGKLKASFFIKREDFINYIKQVSNGKTPPDWATGCFYNGEIQTLLNINDIKDMEYKIHTLTHETVHLYIQKLIYDKHKIDRVTWLDESYACFVDGHTERRDIQELHNISQNLKHLQNFDVNILNDKNKIVTDEYDGYDMFMIIGKYIFDNRLQKEYIQKLINDRKEIILIGKTILTNAIEYIENLYAKNYKK